MNTTPDSGGRSVTPDPLRPSDSANATTVTCPQCEGGGSVLFASNCEPAMTRVCPTCRGDRTITSSRKHVHDVAGVLVLLQDRLGSVVDDLLAGYWTERDLVELAELFEGIARDMRLAAKERTE